MEMTGFDQTLMELGNRLGKYGESMFRANSEGLTDLSKRAETFYQAFFNRLYEWQLININEVTRNAPGIDLGDKTQNTAIQVTATSDPRQKCAKVDGSIEKFAKKRDSRHPGHYKHFTRIIIFFAYGDAPQSGFDRNKDGVDVETLDVKGVVEELRNSEAIDKAKALLELTTLWLDPPSGGGSQNHWREQQAVAAEFQRSIDAWRPRPGSAENRLRFFHQGLVWGQNFTLEARFVNELATFTNSMARAWNDSNKKNLPLSLLPEFYALETEFFYTSLRLMRKIYEPWHTQLLLNPETQEAVWRRVYFGSTHRVECYELVSPPNGDAAAYVDEIRHDLSHLQSLMGRHRVMLRESRPYDSPWDTSIDELL